MQTERPIIYTENPRMLDLSTTNITPIADDEIFVQLEENPRYYISTYSRLYSDRAKKLLKPQLYGVPSKKNRYLFYRINTKNGYKNLQAHKLVAKYFMYNDDPVHKTQIHHLVKNRNDIKHNYYKNLMYVSCDEHRLIESGKRLLLYDEKNNRFIEFKSYRQLSEYVNMNLQKVYNTIYFNKPNYRIKGNINVYKIGEYYVGVENVYDKENLNVTTKGVAIVGLILGIALISRVVKNYIEKR